MRSVQHAKHAQIARRARHAKPSSGPARSTLTAGLTAVLLPLCMVTPALADPGSVDPLAAATSTATIGAPVAAAAVRAPTAKQKADVRLSGPRGAVAPGSLSVAVRLQSDGKPVKDGHVRIEKRSGSGWAYAGRLLTRADGVGSGRVAVTASTQLRAVYAGSASRTAANSSAVTVNVTSGAAGLAALPAGQLRASGAFRQLAVHYASQQAGKPYRYGSTGPSSFDCSGLINYAFARAGKALPRTSGDMYRVSQKVRRGAQQPGDLIFMGSGGRIGHVGVYAGNGKFWDAPRAGRSVSLRPIYSSNYLVGRIN